MVFVVLILGFGEKINCVRSKKEINSQGSNESPMGSGKIFVSFCGQFSSQSAVENGTCRATFIAPYPWHNPFVQRILYEYAVKSS